ncbi:alpha-L-rhamnosidase A [Colletotrichum higginsianum]|nr:alpha-L-rhamnosidase A [Colletotrichum higginsianum]
MGGLWTNVFNFVTAQWSLVSPDWGRTSRQDRLHVHEPSWHRYVRASESRTIRPVGIVPHLTRGAVTNPWGFINGEGGPAIFDRAEQADEAPSVTVDFGQNTVGILSISFAGSSSASSTLPGENGKNSKDDGYGRPGIRLAFSETLRFLSNIAVPKDPYVWMAKHGCQHRDAADGKGQVCADGLHGFRYLRIYLDALPADSPHAVPYGRVEISNLSLALSAFHGTPDTFKGDTFRGSEDAEPRGAGSETLEGKVVIHDAPKRDRDPYVGDLAVAALTGYVSHGKGTVSEASRNVLADLAAHQRGDGWIPPASISMNYTLPLFDYPLWWVVCSHDYVWYTGDLDFLSAHYTNLVAVLDRWYPSVTDSATGLVTKGLNGTAGYGDYAFVPRQGPVTYYNALYVLALRRAAEMAVEAGRDVDAERWRRRAGEVSRALAERNFDEAVGAFWDGTRDGVFVDAHAQDGNSIAILADVGVLGYYARAAARPYGNAFYDSDAVGEGFGERVYAFVSYFELAARFKSRAGRSAVEEMRRLYGWMSRGTRG